jgi:hypothetical protein
MTDEKDFDARPEGGAAPQGKRHRSPDGIRRDARGRFTIGTGGTEGARHNVAVAFLSDLLVDWMEGGPAALAKMRLRRPDRYVQAIVAVLPKEVKMEVSKYEGVSSDELRRRLAGQLEELARAGIVLGGDGDAAGTGEPAAALPPLPEAARIP